MSENEKLLRAAGWKDDRDDQAAYWQHRAEQAERALAEEKTKSARKRNHATECDLCFEHEATIKLYEGFAQICKECEDVICATLAEAERALAEKEHSYQVVHQKIVADAEVIQRENATLRATLARSDERMAEVITDLDAAQHDLNDARATLARVEEQRDFFDGQNASAMETVGKLADDVERLTAERDGLRAALEDAKTALKVMNENLDRVCLQLSEARQIADEACIGLIDIREALKYFERIRAALGRPAP